MQSSKGLPRWNRRILVLKDIVEVRPLGGYRLWLRFEDGVAGEVDFKSLLSFSGVFELLQDPAYFVCARVNPDLRTICWPNDADFDPVVLYAHLTKQPIPDYVGDSVKVNA
jgi:hypothetical protein